MLVDSVFYEADICKDINLTFRMYLPTDSFIMDWWLGGGEEGEVEREVISYHYYYITFRPKRKHSPSYIIYVNVHLTIKSGQASFLVQQNSYNQGQVYLQFYKQQ